MTKHKKPFKIGTYQLNYQWVDLWVEPDGRDGSFDFDSEKDGNARIVLGIAHPDYDQILGTLMHEVLECVSCDLRIRFRRSNSFTGSSDMYTFIMDHTQFTELCARAATYITQCQSDLMTAHLKRHPKNE